mgnify:CR=1 FL=1
MLPLVRISSSISNFKEDLLGRTKCKEWKWNIFTPTVFFGVYHWLDILRIVIHRGEKKVFFCGSDILNLTRFRAFILDGLSFDNKFYCENGIEQKLLLKKEIFAEILPMIFTDFELDESSFVPSRTPHVYLTAHEGRQAEYGWALVEEIAWMVPDVTFHLYGASWNTKHKNVIIHGKVPKRQFNEEIKGYHAALRCNEVDGFSEIVAKSILEGQYPITRIKYFDIDNYETTNELLYKLEQLKEKKFSNVESITWYTRLQENLNQLLTF